MGLWVLGFGAAAVVAALVTLFRGRWSASRALALGVGVPGVLVTILAAPVAVAISDAFFPIVRHTGSALMLVGFGGAILMRIVAAVHRWGARPPVAPPPVPGPRAPVRPAAQTAGPGGAKWLSPPAAPPMWWKDPRTAGTALTDAFRLAAADLAPREAMTTGRLLEAVAHGDDTWQRIWQVYGDPQHLGLATAPDATEPVPGPLPGAEPPRWHGIRLTTRLAQSLWLADRLAVAYGFGPVPAGVVGLALLAYRGNGATEALLAGDDGRYPGILAAVQTDVLGRNLPGLTAHVGNAAWR